MKKQKKNCTHNEYMKNIKKPIVQFKSLFSFFFWQYRFGSAAFAIGEEQLEQRKKC